MNELDETSFLRLADQFLSGLFERLEDALGDDADVDLREGILTVEFDNGGSFVINKHLPNRQIWLSSPLSGAAHFVWDGKHWVATRGGALLLAVLEEDFSKLSGKRIVLD